MTIRIAAAGLALALFAAPSAFAGEPASPLIVAQADTNVTQFLSDERSPDSLNDKELRQRLRAARQLLKSGSLSQGDTKKVRQAMQAARQELQKRGGSATAGNQNGDQGDGAGAQTNQAQKGGASSTGAGQQQAGQQQQQAKQAQTQTAQGGSNADASSYLADTRSADSLTDKELRQRMQAGRNLVKNTSLSKPDRQKARQMMQAARDELQKRKGGNQAGNKAGGDQQATGQGSQKTAATGNVSEYLADNQPVANLSDSDLRQRMRTGRDLMKNSSVSKADRQKVQQVVRALRLELAKRGGGSGNNNSNQPAQPAQPQPGQDQSKNTGGGSSATLMTDNRDAKRLDDNALQLRLKTARDALGSGKLSPAETKALRQKLAADRKELRMRVARKTGGPRGNDNEQAAIDWLKDRREAKDLKERELDRRIAFYRARVDSKDLPAADRARFVVILDRDRAEYRRRLIADRDIRVQKLKRRLASNDINIRININPPGPAIPVGMPPPPIWVAEADDEAIVTRLVQRPARNFDRRYTYREVIEQPEVRQALPAVEVDTVTFGFNEDFVREEQLENLDRIGEILEEILTAHPQEVFLVEGHTDAVGSDAYNLDLSKRRADAIKQALTEYYAISPENLDTVGYGARDLKIRTPEPEEENRRITIRRITPAVGELQG